MSDMGFVRDVDERDILGVSHQFSPSDSMNSSMVMIRSRIVSMSKEKEGVVLITPDE